MKPQFLLCLLVGSRILYMDHPKDHSLFGLRLPGYEAIELEWIRWYIMIHSVQTLQVFRLFPLALKPLFRKSSFGSSFRPFFLSTSLAEQIQSAGFWSTSNVRSGAKNIHPLNRYCKPKVRDREVTTGGNFFHPSCANFLALPNHVWILHDHHASALSRTGFGVQNRGLSPLSSKLGLSSSPGNNETLGYQSFFHTMKSFIDYKGQI